MAYKPHVGAIQGSPSIRRSRVYEPPHSRVSPLCHARRIPLPRSYAPSIKPRRMLHLDPSIPSPRTHAPTTLLLRIPIPASTRQAGPTPSAHGLQPWSLSLHACRPRRCTFETSYGTRTKLVRALPWPPASSIEPSSARSVSLVRSCSTRPSSADEPSYAPLRRPLDAPHTLRSPSFVPSSTRLRAFQTQGSPLHSPPIDPSNHPDRPFQHPRTPLPSLATAAISTRYRPLPLNRHNRPGQGGAKSHLERLR